MTPKNISSDSLKEEKEKGTTPAVILLNVLKFVTIIIILAVSFYLIETGKVADVSLSDIYTFGILTFAMYFYPGSQNK